MEKGAPDVKGIGPRGPAGYSKCPGVSAQPFTATYQPLIHPFTDELTESPKVKGA